MRLAPEAVELSSRSILWDFFRQLVYSVLYRWLVVMCPFPPGGYIVQVMFCFFEGIIQRTLRGVNNKLK
jgi:hypothetical protein